MEDERRTREQLIEELVGLRTQVAELRLLEQRHRALEQEIAQRGRVEARLSEKDRLMAAFHEIGQTILSTLDAERILDEMGLRIAEAGIFRSLMIALVRQAEGCVEVVVGRRAGCPHTPPVRTHRAQLRQ